MGSWVYGLPVAREEEDGKQGGPRLGEHSSGQDPQPVRHLRP